MRILGRSHAGRRVDIAGLHFGQLTAVEPTSIREHGSVVWRCVCDCGREAFIGAGRLRSELVRSCGCTRAAGHHFKHGHARKGRETLTFRSWTSMLQRCLNPNSDNYRWYGGRGITICLEWIDSFDAFLADMGERPTGMTLDRINPDGNYEPGNVRWATPKEQARNRRRARR
jgi:hypothetical protein